MVPKSKKKFVSLSEYIGKFFTIKFVDTFRFMAPNLSNLASNLLTGYFRNFRETAKVFSPADLLLVTRKDVYPYEYINIWGKLE